jgi:transposase
MDEIHIPIACPELNPCEGVWDWSKLNDMWNVTPQGFEELFPEHDHLSRNSSIVITSTDGATIRQRLN